MAKRFHALIACDGIHAKKTFPTLFSPLYHLECIAAFTNLFASRIHGNSCPNLLSTPLFDNRGTFLFRMPDFCILQHNLHHGHDHQYSLHSCSFFFHNPHSRIYSCSRRCNLHNKLHHRIGKWTTQAHSLDNTASHIHHFTWVRYVR